MTRAPEIFASRQDLLALIYLGLAGLLGCPAVAPASPPEAGKPAKKIVLIAGTKSHGPGEHEYEKGVKLLKHCLDTSPNLHGVKTEVYLDGWPADDKVLDDADTILLFSDGSDRDEKAHPLLRDDRLKKVQRLVDRGVGFVAIHYTVFVPSKRGGEQFLDWLGGYFDYENGPKPRGWYSKIQVCTAKATPASPEHPVCRGLRPFELKEEFYYNMRFRPDDPRRVPILTVPIPGEPKDQVVAWAVQRKDGGRGFGFTGGHFHSNWRVPNFRKMVLNALVWTARAEVPAGGVESTLPKETDAKGPGAQAAPDTRPLVPGKFASALNARHHHAAAKTRAAYQKPPLTAECWARLDDAKGFNLLVANNFKESNTHWEIYSIAGTGNFAAFLPGYTPDVIDSRANIVDGRWHYLAMTYEGDRVRLYVDAKNVADVRITPRGGQAKEGPLYFGAYPPQSLGCDGLVDEVRISRVVRSIAMPAKAPVADEDTIGLWHFDRLVRKQMEDGSRLNNAAVVDDSSSAQKAVAGPSSATELDYRPADPRLKAVLLDRSPSESYVSVKADSEGRLFVGGREALFVFEPDARGGYGPARELYRFPPDSWVAGIEVRGDDLYAMTASALYLFPGGRTKRSGLKPRRLVWGLPLDLHVSYHCLAWGPEGDLYFNHGDPLLNYGDFNRPDHWGHWIVHTQPEGTTVPYTGVGGVFRVRPDGSGFQVVAEGLRGCFGLAFDRRWNLFTNDNDHESIPDRYTPARLLYVSPHIDFAWPRGWMASKSPDRFDLVEPMLSTPGRGVPVGLAYCDEPFLPTEYRNNLLQDRWDRLTIDRYPLEHRGAGFSAPELPFLVGRQNARPIGVAVGRGGRIFATISYMAGNEASPKYLSDLIMITRADDPAGHPFEPYDAANAPPAKLWAELSNASWQRRAQAHQEILRRGGALLDESARKLSEVKDGDPALFHLPWLAGVSGTAQAARALSTLSRDRRPEVRTQAVRVVAEFSSLDAAGDLGEAALSDQDAQVRLAALAGLFKTNRELPLEPVVRAACSEDTYLRQTATRLLARRATLAQITGLAKSRDAAVRLAGTLAAGFRLTIPPKDQPPPKEVPLSYPSGNAFFQVKVRYADGDVDLRTLGRIGSYTTAEYWKAITPNVEQKALFELLMRALDDRAEPVRLQAAYFLSLLRDPRSEPAVARAMRAVQEQRLAGAPVRAVDRVWAVGPFDDGNQGFGKVHPPEQGAIDLTAEYPGSPGKLTWQELSTTQGKFDLGRKVGTTGDGSSYLFFRLESPTRQRVLLLIDSGRALKAWHNGARVAERKPSDGGPPVAESILLDVQPGSNDLLVRVGTPGDGGLRLRYRARGPVNATLPEKLGMAGLAERLKEASRSGGQAAVGPEFLSVDWPAEVRRGDVAQGRKLFGALGCVKCHAVTADQKGGGAPSLTDVGRRFTVPYLVESVLLPSKQVAEPFRATTVVMQSGQGFSGLVVNETADQIELLLADASRKTIRKKDIEERNLTNVSPMPAGLVKSPKELRDLLAYLLSDHPLPP